MTEIKEPLKGRVVSNLTVGSSDMWMEFTDGSILHIEIKPDTDFSVFFNKSKHNPIRDAETLWTNLKEIQVSK